MHCSLHSEYQLFIILLLQNNSISKHHFMSQWNLTSIMHANTPSERYYTAVNKSNCSYFYDKSENENPKARYHNLYYTFCSWSTNVHTFSKQNLTFESCLFLSFSHVYVPFQFSPNLATVATKQTQVGDQKSD